MSASPVVGTREIAYRVFAAEFDDASLSYSESDEERAPNYVVTPTGARLNRTFVAGVLTEVEHVNDEVLRGRIADPTGAFVTYAGQYQPEPMAYLDAATPPAFVSLAGKARTYEPDDADVVYSSVRPESVNTVDADVRDRWIVSAAEATLRRIAVFDEALSMPYRGDDLTRALEARGVDSTLAAGVPRAIDHYGTTRTYLDALREVAVQALELVAGDRDQVDPLDVAPGDGGDAVLGPLPELDLEPADSVDIVVDEADADADADLGAPEADADEVEAEPDDFETEADSEPAATLDSEPEFDDGAESEAVEPESESEPIAEPDSEPESASDPEPVAAETTTSTEGHPEASEPEPASEPSATVDAEPEPEPAAEPESEPAAEPDLTSEPEPVTDSLDTESEPDFDAGTDDGALGDFEDDAPDAGATDAGSLDDSGSGTLGDFDDGFDDPDPEAGDSTGSTDSASADADDSVDPDGMYELDEDERAEIESEFGTEFTSGADVDPAGEADIDVPDADDLTEQLEDESAAAAEPDPEPATDAAAEPEPAVDSEPEPEPTPDAASDGDEDEADADADADESAEDIDLESVVVDAMDDLDGGDGATRDEVVAAVVDEYGADPGAVEDAIQEALLGGRCYEPQDGVLKAI
ncbi:rpa-associated protein [Haloferax sp. Atlit-48N]|uniref:Rpa-associated protein n=1 Tax=Haloferax sp. Atlit-48N TaxID=2077198 RepID=A0ACD5I2X9_9EURY|nr:rpa-associated protein [Haloferax sp. Atlit-48N]RDZ32532.1 rpa-associated protein [Haloferax sp. Atlit-48N]